MAITFFLVSVGLALAVIVRQKIRLLSPYGIFLAFQCLYNVIPWMFGETFGLDENAVTTEILLSATSNIAFAIAISIFYRAYDFMPTRSPEARSLRRYLLACIPLFSFAAIICHYYGWHIFAESGSTAQVGGMASIAAYAKHACIAAFLYYLGRFGLDRYSWALFTELMIIMAIDGGRTNFFPVIVITLMFWQSTKEISGWKIAVAFVVGVVALTALRGMLIGASGLDVVLGGVVFEGCMGSYSSIQSIYAVQHMPAPPYLFGIGSLQSWASGIYPSIQGEFSPIGGFYYIGGAVADFGYIGPALETFIFGYILCASEKWKQNKPLIYLAFVATMGTLFAKVTMANCIKLFLAQLFCLSIYTVIRKVKQLLAKSAREPAGFVRRLDEMSGRN